MISQIQIKR